MLAVLDYEAGNQTSVLRALRGMGIPAQITADGAEIAAASGVIFPGVGAAGQAMALLRRTGMDALLRKLVEEGKPLLGICLGCQILLDHSAEGDTELLGIIRGGCLRFDAGLKDEQGEPIVIPHMGWNGVKLERECLLFDGVPADAEFYFVHSYYVNPAPELRIGLTFHGAEFCSVYGRSGLWGVQFHPEKSGKPGLCLLKNFYDYCRGQGSLRKH
jgi:glutamine amidotransferase